MFTDKYARKGYETFTRLEKWDSRTKSNMAFGGMRISLDKETYFRKYVNTSNFVEFVFLLPHCIWYRISHNVQRAKTPKLIDME